MAASNNVVNLNQFAVNLFNTISGGKNDNLFISPFSISTCLAMCYVGARNDTATQLKTLLNLNSLSDEQILDLNGKLLTSLNSLGDSVALSTANKIFPKSGFEINKDYVASLTKNFGAELEQLDFGKSQESADKINNWVAAQTQNKIQNLIQASALNDLTRLVLVNAIYFKGKWANQFEAKNTYEDDFNLADGSKKKVQMMKLINKKFKFQINPAGITATTCQFPYAGDKIAMTIILPHEGIKIEDVEKQLTGEVLTDLLQTGNQIKVHAYVPKFKLELKTELNEHLLALGAKDAFHESKADFSGINDKEQLYISKVLHQAVVEVNEEGTEAAAATAAIMMVRCAIIDHPPEEFKCNRPFLFLIHDIEHTTPLFLGRYSVPQ